MRRSCSLLIFCAWCTACADDVEVLRADDGVAVQALTTGDAHTCALASGRAYCFGAGEHGALGRGSAVASAPVPAVTPGLSNIVSLAAGGLHSCAADAKGSTWCWGGNAQGQLGLGDTADRYVPQLVPLTVRSARVVTNFLFTCALGTDQSAWCWGQNYEGQLALGDEPSEAGVPNPTRIGADSDWLDISTGQGHACGIRRPGALYCWGRNTESELGIGRDPIQIRAFTRTGSDDDWQRVSSSQSQNCALKSDGSLWCWGGNWEGQLGTGDKTDRDFPTRVAEGRTWSSVSLNTFHACGLSRGELWCWGRNVEGQLGTGDTEARLSPTRIGADADWAVVSAGRFFTCAVKENGSLWCTGDNEHGQLGTGDLARRAAFTRIRMD